DVNADGKLDVIASIGCIPGSGGCVRGAFAVLLGNGDGTFQPPLTYASGGHFASSIVVVDVDGNRRPDLLVANRYHNYFQETHGAVGVLLGTARSLTTTEFTSSLNPSIYGQKVTWRAAVMSSGPTTPTGYVAFRWSQNGVTYGIGRAALNASGVAVL